MNNTDFNDVLSFKATMLSRGSNTSKTEGGTPTVSILRTLVVIASHVIFASTATFTVAPGTRQEYYSCCELPGASPTLSEHTMDEKVTAAPPTIAFMNTALVDAINGAKNCRARIALDTGGSSSLITESLASHETKEVSSGPSDRGSLWRRDQLILHSS